jgi:hypothetical protein
MKNQELIYYPSRTKALLILIGSIAFVAMGWWVKEEEPLIGWLGVVLFGLGIPAALIMLLPGVMYLRLDPDGIEMCSIGRKNKIRWQDVESFKIVYVRWARAEMIAINYRASFKQKVALAVVGALFGQLWWGAIPVIPNIYNVSLEELERVLNQWLERFGQVEAQTDV